MKLIILILLFLSFIIPAHSSFGELSDISIGYEIYFDFLRQEKWERLEEEKIINPTFVIEQMTHVELDSKASEPWRVSDSITREFNNLQPSALESFEDRNMNSMQLEVSGFKILPVIILTSQEAKEYFGEDGTWWPGFYQKYPDTPGLITLSLAGISADRKQALLYYGYQWDGKAGKGGFVLLSYDGMKWVIKQEVIIWLS